MAGSFKVLGGMLNDRPFLIWEVLKTISIRVGPIIGSKTFDIYFSMITRTSFRRRKPGVDGSL